MPLTDIEFFTYEEEIWIRWPHGAVMRLTESDTVIIDKVTEMLETFYPEAYRALSEEYSACAPNMPYFRYRIVSRFIRCNFANLDHIPDFTATAGFNFEAVACPLRGECRHHRVICRPSFAHRLTPSELRVLRPLFQGMSEPDIAATLCLSVHTVHNHIRNAYTRLGIHSKAEFIKYATQHQLFGNGQI